MTAPSINQPTNYMDFVTKLPNHLDFVTKLRGNPDSLKRICRIIALAVKSFATLAASAPLQILAGAATLTFNSINAIQIINPFGYFFNGGSSKVDAKNADHVINASDLYLSLCDVTGWAQEHAKDLATYAYAVGKRYPLLDRVVASNIAKFALPVVVILCGTDLYKSVIKLNASLDVVEKNKAKFSIAKDVGQIAFAVLAMAALTQPLIVAGALTLEFTNLFVGLASDGYNILNP